MKLPKAPRTAPAVIGWREAVSLPGLGVVRIRAKIDTGARTSSLHAENVELFERDGVHWVRFRVPQDGARGPIVCEAPHVERRSITSSTGHKVERLIIKTEMQLGDAVFPAEIGLADRAYMGFPMLVGRTALRKRFLVNPERSFMLESQNRRRGTGK